jgi:hypothetical protein
MGRSNSFNKRELEKKKEQRRKEKLKRKVDRKANGIHGSFEDMIAYVDQNGVISSTPPDTVNKQEEDAETIVVSVAGNEKTE